MKWIGLTGGIATGKSTVAKMLRDFGLPVLDADELARKACEPGSESYQEIIDEFGRVILDTEGFLDREKLGRIVFNDSKKRSRLEEIIHPRIQDLRAREKLRLENAGAEIAFYDVPLLFEKKLESEFDATILVYAPVELQKERLRERNKYTELEIETRLKSQMPIDDKIKMANYIIFNKGSLTELKANVVAVLNELGATTPTNNR